MHMLRNAVSHGIETPEERGGKGKDAAGTGHAPRRRPNRTGFRIVVEDDGRGIDFRRIAEKAVEQGRLTREEARTASEQTLVPLPVRAGLFHRRGVTTISGRGVGLSVAQRNGRRPAGHHRRLARRPAAARKIEVSLPVSILAAPPAAGLAEGTGLRPAVRIRSPRCMRVDLSDIDHTRRPAGHAAQGHHAAAHLDRRAARPWRHDRHRRQVRRIRRHPAQGRGADRRRRRGALSASTISSSGTSRPAAAGDGAGWASSPPRTASPAWC